MTHFCRVKAGPCNRIHGMFDKLRQDQMAGRAMEFFSICFDQHFTLAKVHAHVSNDQSNEVQGQ